MTRFSSHFTARSVTGLALLAMVVATAVPAQASTITFASDADFVAYEIGGGFVKEFGGNVRWGNGTGAGDWEYAVVNASDAPIGAVAQSAWAGSNQHDVTFSYDGIGNTTLTLSGIGSLTRSVTAAPNQMFARVRDSVSVFSSLSQIEVDLAFNGVGVDYSFNLLTGDANAEYWGIFDPNLQFGFTLTADASLDGPRSAGSDPMYQFKVGVPEPASLIFVLAGMPLLLRRRSAIRG